MRPLHVPERRRRSGGRLSGSIQYAQDMAKLTCVNVMPEQTVIVAGSPVALPKVGKKTRRGKKGGRRHRKRLQEKLFLEMLGDERVQDIRRGVEALHVACLSDVSEGAGPHLTNTSVHTSQPGDAEQTRQVALPFGYSATRNINEYGYHPTGCGYANDNYGYAQNGCGYGIGSYGYAQYGYGYDIGNYGYARCGYGYGDDNYGYAQNGYGYGY